MHTVGVDGFKGIIQSCLQVADYAVNKLNELGRHAWRHPYANTVVFDRPAISVTQHWQLAYQGNISHLITMPHVTNDHIDRLVADIIAAEPIQTITCEAFAACETTNGTSDREIILLGRQYPNLLSDVATALASAGISIEGLTAVKVEEGNVVKLSVTDRDRALRILNQTLDIGRCYGQSCSFDTHEASQILSQIDYQAVSGDALLVELDDRAGTLALLMKQCHDHQISLRSMRLLWRGKHKAVVELASSEPEKLKLLLGDRILIP